jgi:hypothetical protein
MDEGVERGRRTNERKGKRWRLKELRSEKWDFCFVLLHFTDEIGFERAWRVVPFEAFSISIPQLETVLLLAVLVLEVIWFTSVPVCEGDGPPVGHPEEVALVGEIGARRPEVLIAKTCKKSRHDLSCIDWPEADVGDH